MLKLKSANTELKIKANEYRMASAYRNAVKEYLSAIMIEKNDFEIYFGLGVSYKFLNKTSKAIDALEKAAALNDRDANVFYELGICYLIEGQICSAMHNLIKCINLDKTNLNAQIQLAMAHEAAEEPEMALLIYQKIMESNPHYVKAYEHASFLLMDMQKYKQAGQILNRLVKIFPECTHAYLGLGICFEKLGKILSAKRCYRRFLILTKEEEQKEFVQKKLSKFEKNVCPAEHLSIVNV
ncbi:tetratricopeptide repeat protein [bacterium]|nr:tetratricopeptide repeat protein [bacterium]